MTTLILFIMIHLLERALFLVAYPIIHLTKLEHTITRIKAIPYNMEKGIFPQRKDMGVRQESSSPNPRSRGLWELPLASSLALLQFFVDMRDGMSSESYNKVHD